MRPHILCLTAVRNEAPRLPAFLAAASTWADAIVVADQGSDDGSRDIARAHPKVLFVDNPDTDLGNPERQRLLVDAARAEFPGDRVLLLIDADEMLTFGASGTPDWTAVAEAPPGTPIRMRWIHPWRGWARAWVQLRPKRFGLVDDGSPPATGLMNPGRLGRGTGPTLRLENVGVLHFQFIDWELMKAKQRWYQIWASLFFPEQGPMRVYRQYHWMDAVGPDDLVPADPTWWAGYEATGVDVGSMGAGSADRWDSMTLQLIERHGAERFRRLDLWDHDWSAAARDLGCAVPVDPRRATDRWALRALAATQGEQRRVRRKLVQRTLGLAGW